MEAASASETSKRNYHHTRRNNAEDYRLKSICSESLQNNRMMVNLSEDFSALHTITLIRTDAMKLALYCLLNLGFPAVVISYKSRY